MTGSNTNMTWKQRYNLRIFLWTTLWPIPLACMSAAVLTARLTFWVDRWAGWSLALSVDGARAVGGTLTGSLGQDGNSTELFEGTVAGDDVAWKVSITNPMPLTLAFTGKVAGDAMSGEMGIGMMGSFPFTGKRA